MHRVINTSVKCERAPRGTEKDLCTSIRAIGPQMATILWTGLQLFTQCSQLLGVFQALLHQGRIPHFTRTESKSVQKRQLRGETRTARSFTPHSWSTDECRVGGELQESRKHPPVSERRRAFLLHVTVIQISMHFPIKGHFYFSPGPVVPVHQ